MQFDRAFYEQQGLGLGFVIAKRLVELHEGKIEAKSREDLDSVDAVEGDDPDDRHGGPDLEDLGGRLLGRHPDQDAVHDGVECEGDDSQRQPIPKGSILRIAVVLSRQWAPRSHGAHSYHLAAKDPALA